MIFFYKHDQVTFLLLQGTTNHPKVTAVIGSGASAVTTLRALKNLASEPQKGVGVVSGGCAGVVEGLQNV